MQASRSMRWDCVAGGEEEEDDDDDEEEVEEEDDDGVAWLRGGDQTETATRLPFRLLLLDLTPAEPTRPHTPFTVVHRLVIYPTWAQSRWPIIVQAHHALCDCHVGPSTTWTYSLLSFLLSLVNGQPSTSQLHTLLLLYF